MKRWWKSPLFSPRGLILRAALIAFVYGVLHLAGLRANAAFLSGTPVGGTLSTLAGVIYVLAYFSFVVAAPILLLAGGLLAVAGRVSATRARE